MKLSINRRIEVICIIVTMITLFPSFSSNAKVWTCWGNKYISNKVANLTTDVCTAVEDSKVYVDVYLKNINISQVYSWNISGSLLHYVSGKTEDFERGGTAVKVYNHKAEMVIPVTRTGEYVVRLELIDLEDLRSTTKTTFRQIRNEIVDIEVPPLDAVKYIISDATYIAKSTARPIQFTFGKKYQMPIINYSKGSYTISDFGTLLIFPISNNQDVPFIPHLLGDTHEGIYSRCENTPNARTGDGTLEQAELYTPVGAWSRMNRPLVVFNTNYFDVRPQLNGTTWKQNNCSTPLGMYFDNIPNSPTSGTHNRPNAFFAGPQYFIDEDNKKAALDTLFWDIRIGADPWLQLYNSPSPTSTAIETIAKNYVDEGKKFLAISGTGLVNRTVHPEPAPDSGSSFTTRTVVATSNNSSIFYVFQGGSYTNGLSRNELYGLFYGLGFDNVMELDGGGSAGIALSDDRFDTRGDVRPPSSCNVVGIWCSPIIQPDGTARPVPSWMAIDNK